MSIYGILNSMLSGILSTVIGGVILALIFFWLREKFFALPEVSGRWKFTTHTKKSDYNPYKDMELTFIAAILREGNKIEGTYEKVYEKSVQGDIPYDGNKRSRGIIRGYIQKNYLSTDMIYIHLVEKGEQRESTSFQKLKICKCRRKIEGDFFSKAGNQYGLAEWKRE